MLIMCAILTQSILYFYMCVFGGQCGCLHIVLTFYCKAVKKKGIFKPTN